MLLTLVLIHDKLVLVEMTFYILEVYPSSAEGIGLENRQAGNTARGFESLYLLHFELNPLLLCNGFFYV